MVAKACKVFTVLLVMFLIGCAGGQYYQNIPPELVPLARYDEALTTYVAVKQNFNLTVASELDPTVRKKMLDIAYPLFESAAVGLTAWELALQQDSDPAAKIRAYQTIWLELVNALLQMGIVEVK